MKLTREQLDEQVDKFYEEAMEAFPGFFVPTEILLKNCPEADEQSQAKFDAIVKNDSRFKRANWGGVYQANYM